MRHARRGRYDLFAAGVRRHARRIWARCARRELECCCQVLGINDLRWLDWPDGGVSALDRDQASAEVVAIIRQVRPQVMITHPDHGGYPHPDHLAIHDIALAAWQAAADSDYRPDLGPAHAVTKLYGRVIPMSFFLQAPEFAEYRVQLNGDQLPFVATPDEDVSTVLDVAAWADRRVAGWECHQSQHNPNGAFSQVPDEVQQDFRSREYLQLIAHRLADNPSPETDLFAGMVPDTEIKSNKPESDVLDGMNPGIQIEQDEPETPALRGKAADALAMRLLDAVRSNSTHVLLYQEYRKRSRQEDVIALLDMLIDGSQEAIALSKPNAAALESQSDACGHKREYTGAGILAQGHSKQAQLCAGRSGENGGMDRRAVAAQRPARNQDPLATIGRHRRSSPAGHQGDGGDGGR